MQNRGVKYFARGYILSVRVLIIIMHGQNRIWILAWVTMILLFTLFSWLSICNVRIWMKIADEAKMVKMGNIKVSEMIGSYDWVQTSTCVIISTSSSIFEESLGRIWSCLVDPFGVGVRKVRWFLLNELCKNDPEKSNESIPLFAYCKHFKSFLLIDATLESRCIRLGCYFSTKCSMLLT